MPTYTFGTVEVNFPYNAYDCQQQYMQKVIEALSNNENALLESPTGTGKTLCLLCATLAWRESLKHAKQNKVEQVKEEKHSSYAVQGFMEDWAAEKALKNELPTIIYASRTHSQLQQVIKELKSTAYKPRTAVLFSRQHGCQNPVVKDVPGTAGNALCRKLVTKGGCKWHYGADKYASNNPDANSEILDIEELGRLGQTRTICPYYLSRSFSMGAELIFMPYNYLMDPKFRGGLSIDWKKAVLIFDEAHNVEGTCSDAVSFDLPATVIHASMTEAGEAAEIATKKAESERGMAFNSRGTGGPNNYEYYTQLSTSLRQLQMILFKFESLLTEMKIPAERGITQPGIYLFEEIFAKFNLNDETWGTLSTAMDEALRLLTDEAADQGRQFSARNATHRLFALREALSLAFLTLHSFENSEEPRHKGYRVHIRLEMDKYTKTMVPTLSYWCFSPGHSMTALSEMKVGSILLTSGTLSPMDSFAEELSLPFPVQLENPHVIDTSQVWVGVVPVGPSGHKLNSSYQTRNSREYKEDLGNAIVNFARTVPDGLLVFFPSYIVLQSCIEFWKTASSNRNMGGSIWSRIESLKAPIVEPRDANMFPEAAAQFRAKLDDPQYRGAAFFAVCRGKVSEGLDFSDRAGRAVIITGIPYAMKTDPKVRIKQEVLDQNRMAKMRNKRPHNALPPPVTGLTGSEWYVQQAIRAVNQAMGRVIRHVNDYGAIILLDERFKSENIRNQLSKWLRDKVEIYPTYGAATGSLTQFFKQRASSAQETRRLEIQYESLQQQQQQQQQRAQGPFQVAAPSGGFGRQQQAAAGFQAGGPLVRHIPAAMDMLGVEEIIGDVAAHYDPDEWKKKQQIEIQQQRQSKGGLLDMLKGQNGSSGNLQGKKANSGGNNNNVNGRPPRQPIANVSSIDALCSVGIDQQRQEQPGFGGAANNNDTPSLGSGSMTGVAGLKPWELESAAPLHRPGGLRRGNSFSSGGDGLKAASTVPELPAVVGPAHKIEEHHRMKQQQQQQQEKPEGVTESGKDKEKEGAISNEGVNGDSSRDPQQQQKRSLPVVGDVPANAEKKAAVLPNGQTSAPVSGSTTSKSALISAYLQQLQAELSPEALKVVKTTLQAYARNKDDAEKCRALVEGLIKTLIKSQKPKLVEGLRVFVPKDSWWPSDVELESIKQQVYERATTSLKVQQQPVAVQPSQKSQPGAVNGKVAPAQSRPPAGGSIQSGGLLKSGKQGGGNGKRGLVCAQCKKSPCVSPYESPCCKRVACFACWKPALAMMSCPGCGKGGLKQRNLTQIFFK